MTQSHSFLCVSLSSKPVNSLRPKISCFILSFMCWQTNNNPQMSSKVFFSTFAIIQVSKLPITTPWLSGQAMLTRKYEHHVCCIPSFTQRREGKLESIHQALRISRLIFQACFDYDDALLRMKFWQTGQSISMLVWMATPDNRHNLPTCLINYKHYISTSVQILLDYWDFNKVKHLLRLFKRVNLW